MSEGAYDTMRFAITLTETLNKCIKLALCLSVSIVGWQAPVNAEFTSSLNDNYLAAQFDFAAFLQPEPVEHYLNYDGSRLKSLTRVRIYSREFQHGAFSGASSPARLYQELWYQEATSIGLRQKSKLNLPQEKTGAIVVGQCNANAQEPRAVGNALIRLLMDLHFKHLVVSVVLLPMQSFDQIAQSLGNYNFFRADDPPEGGEHFSVCLRSYPQGKEEYYYYSR